MKIGILTLPLNYNYGGILQAYALQTYLERAGHDVWLIDRQRKTTLLRGLAGVSKRAVQKYLLRKKIVVLNSSYQRQVKEIGLNTQRFIKQYIRHTDRLYTTANLKRAVVSGKFEVLVVGSDQVWRADYSPSLKNYFLDFLPGKLTLKRLAYAASFGLDKWMWPASLTQSCGELLQRFDAVGIREASGVQLCQQFLGVDAVQTIDPTLLLRPVDYLQLVNTKKENPESLFVYMLDNTPNKQEATDRVANYTGLKPFRLEIPSPYSDNAQIQPAAPVEEWLSAFRDAQYIITDSFHGCVFSILFNKPFIVYSNSGRGMTRFTSLLDLFGLQNRMISASEEVNESVVTAPISWQKVNAVLEKERESTASFFKKNL